MPSATSAFSIAASGSVEKYAAGPPAREPEVHDRRRPRVRESYREPLRRVGVVNGQNRAEDAEVADPTSVDGLGQPLGGVDGVSPERLEPGDEDDAIFRHRLFSGYRSVCHIARQPRCTSGERRGSVTATATAIAVRMSHGRV